MVDQSRSFFVTVRNNVQLAVQMPSSSLSKLCFWKKKAKMVKQNIRTVVPNHLVPEDSPTEQHPNHGYLGNRIRTTKYTLLSFLPKNLFEQFHRFANLYFLLIVLLNWIPQINAFGKEIAMIPVIFVLGVTAVKDIFEDRRRHISDKRINNSTCRIYNRTVGRYVKTTWKSLRVGDIVHLSHNEVIPADILLLKSSDEQGICYIETANLDGENNLKQRQVVRGFASQKDSFLPPLFRSIIECDLPNNKIYRFYGSLIHPNGEKVPISKDNLLLRDCVLKNTDFVEGIVVYAGHETKAMLNNNGPRYKRSKLEKRMNWDVVWCVVILVVLCFIGATGSGFWIASFNDTHSVPFIKFEDEKRYNPEFEGFLSFWTFVIILQIMIPLSLYVSIEIIKLGQVYLIHNDLQLYDSATNKRVECRALNIPEEIGQVEFIFSDKTGTLTENEMIFRRCTIGGIDYNHHRPSISENASADMYSRRGTYDPSGFDNSDFIVNSRLQDELSHMDLQLMICQGNSQVYLLRQSQRIQDFFLLLSVCNTVVVSKHPHCDKMNSSGLYLNSANNVVHEDSPDLRLKTKNAASQTKNLLTPNASPSLSYNSTPVKKRRLLTLPLFGTGNGKPASPTPSPSEIRPIYEAESPDELALVTAAYRYNCRLLKRMADSITLSLPGEGIIEFQLLHLLPFDPQRKRMSIILQHPFTKQKILYCKGADSSMFSSLAPPQDDETEEIIFKTQQQLNNYARRGLRILVMAKKVLSQEEYNEWSELHRAAELAIEDREQCLQESACRIETNMELLGATGIEDRLQEGVPETIATLREAGIVIWVLTGDKQETAVNIAHSCHLFSNDMEIITINARSKEAVENTIKFQLEEAMKEDISRPSTPTSIWSSTSTYFNSGRRKRGLVIDGRTLALILDKEIDNSFLKLAQHCSAVLCCRATPIQKASIVKLVKDQLHVLTLAIGDGANDVSMIQTADVGIGISGQEGMQAVMASDFAMARFKYLQRLLLVHGHWCYDRLARMVLYFFYKNAGLIFIIFWYQMYCGFSGMVMIDQLYIMLYNLIFTSLPPLIIGIYDQDAPSELLLKKTYLYQVGRLSQVYRPHSFWVNIADAFYQSIIIFFFTMQAYHDSTVGLWEFGTTITTCCLSVQLLHLCIECKSWTILHVVSMIFSVAVFVGFGLAYNMICYSCQSLPNPYWVMQHTMESPVYWFNILLVSVVALLPRLTIRLLQSCLHPSEVTLALLAHKDECTQAVRDISVAWSRSTSISSVVRISDLSYHNQHTPVPNSMTEVV